MPLLIVANPSAGTSDDDLASRALARLEDAHRFDLGDRADLGGAISSAVAEGRTVVACGGDGTVNTVVQHVAPAGGVLGVLPGGTLNHFARDLGVQDPAVALRALERHRVATIDVGRVGDSLFVNNVALGIYPELVRERERHEHSLGKWLALAVGARQVFRTFEPVRGTIVADGDRRELEATLVLVGNNRYSTTPGSIGMRDRLDEGVLDVRVIRARHGLRARSSLAFGVIRSGWRRRFVGTTATRVHIEAMTEEPFAVDGEQRDDSRRLDISIVPRGLRVVRWVDTYP
jgi:undecaprenyl-diphosphatase